MKIDNFQAAEEINRNKYQDDSMDIDNNDSVHDERLVSDKQEYIASPSIITNTTTKANFPDKILKKEKQSLVYLKYKYNDSAMENLNTNIKNKFKEHSYSDQNVIYDMDADNPYLNSTNEVIESHESHVTPEESDYNNVNNSQLSESEESNLKFKEKVKKIKDLRTKKRETEHKEETYDQDYIEMKQTNTSELIEGIISYFYKQFRRLQLI